MQKPPKSMVRSTTPPTTQSAAVANVSASVGASSPSSSSDAQRLAAASPARASVAFVALQKRSRSTPHFDSATASEQFQAVGAALGRDVGLPLTATSRSHPDPCIRHSAGDALDHGFVLLQALFACENSAQLAK